MLKSNTLCWLTAIWMMSDRSQSIQSERIKVDPPENILILDPGHLGQLYIHWSHPASLQNLTDCSMRFQLEYLNTYLNRWTAVRTVEKGYSAQFDLEKEVRVRICTLLRGPCTNGSEIKSPFTEVVLPSTNIGPIGSRIQGFGCVFYHKVYMECTWERGPEEPAHSQHGLYFWHREMEHARECPEYTLSDGVRMGCNFTLEFLAEFTDFNICVNNSSPAGPMRPAFFSLQVQNHVKPEATETLHVEPGPDKQLQLQWDYPCGRIPSHCLEWEMEARQEDLGGQQLLLQREVTRETTRTYQSMDESKRNCFRVRSKMHQYCADRGYWSDWSHWSCHSDMADPEQGWDAAVVCALVVIVITMLVFSLCGWTLWRKLKAKKGKKVFFCPLPGEMDDSTGPAYNPFFQ